MASPATARNYLGATPEERRLLRREQLLKAGCDVYAARGYRNATIKAICEQAGLTERYFYESFANNEALFLALFKNVTQKMLDGARAAGDGVRGTPAEKARAILNAYYHGLQAEPAPARVFVIEAADISPAAHEIARHTFERFADLLAEAWNGRPVELDPVLRVGVGGMILHIARDWICNGFSRPTKSVVDAALRISAVLADAKPKPRRARKP